VSFLVGVLAGVFIGGLGWVVYWRAEYSRYSIWTFDAVKRVHRESVAEEGHKCKDCDVDIEAGERRTWYVEYVAAGIVLYRDVRGQNRYCDDHASFEYRNQIVPIADQKTRRDRAIKTAVSGVTALDTHAGVVPSKTEDSPFQNTAQTVSVGIDLVPVAFLVITATIVLSIMGRRGESQ